MNEPAPPRLIPDRTFPPYSYAPGLYPHPISDTEGHSFGVRGAAAVPVDESSWSTNHDYLHGIDLFNHGYYWEAHEVWEGLWHAARREGIVADFLKGLIQMTAAGVKVRQGMPRGVASLGSGAADLFEYVRGRSPERSRFLGLDLNELLAFTRDLAARPEAWTSRGEPVERIFTLVLNPL